MFDATGDMTAQKFLLDARKGGANGRDLGHDVDAIAVLIDHLREAADLAFDTVEAPLRGGLDVFQHRAYIPP